MKKEHIILLTVNLAALFVFGSFFILRQNYEFLIYVGVIIFFMCLVGVSLTKVNYTRETLIGLTVWAILHLAGGGVPVGDGRLYDVMLFRVIDNYPIFRYDQLVHIFGFASATLVSYCLLSALLKDSRRISISLGIVLVMAGLGIGALNEILEFIVSTIVPESGVGGYINTSLDLCADLIGAVMALFFIRFRYMKNNGTARQTI